MKIAWIGCSVVLVSCLASTHAGAQGLKFTTQDFPPFSYPIEGAVSGPAVEVIRRVCKEMTTSCSFRLLPWSRAQQQVRTGEANGMFVIGWNKKRSKWVHFTPPIMNTEYGIFVNKSNSLNFTKLSDVSGYKIGVYGPSNTSNSLKKIKAKMAEEGLKPISITQMQCNE